MVRKFKYLRTTFRVLIVLLLILAWLWGATALYIAGPNPQWLNSILAIFFVVFMPLSFAFSRSFLKGVILCLGLFAIVILWWQTLTPTHEKDWAPDVAKISHGTIQGDTLTMYNVRNFDYKTEQIFLQDWDTRTYDLRNLQGLDIFLSYWASEHIAHTIMSWDFGVDGHLAVSIETRKDKTQKYSAVKGFFKQFEIAYVAADERDIIRLRTNYRKERVYVYRLLAENQQVLALLKDYLKKMNSLFDKPEFYNALTHNCTTTIQLHANTINPGVPPPLDWRIIATGHVDEMLYDHGEIITTLPFAELRRSSRVDLKMQKEGKENFSKKMRQYVRDSQDVH
jgi:hypothetical protein